MVQSKCGLNPNHIPSSHFLAVLKIYSWQKYIYNLRSEKNTIVLWSNSTMIYICYRPRLVYTQLRLLYSPRSKKYPWLNIVLTFLGSFILSVGLFSPVFCKETGFDKTWNYFGSLQFYKHLQYFTKLIVISNRAKYVQIWNLGFVIKTKISGKLAPL